MTRTDKYLGISFGTSFCRTARVTAPTPDSGVASTESDDATPTAFYAGSTGTVIGAAALAMLHDAKKRKNVRGQIARHLGKQSLYPLADHEYTPGRIASLILQELREAAERKAGGSFSHAAIAYPVWFDAVAEGALRDAGAAAGLANATLLSQAQATTVAFLRTGHVLGQRVLVIDIGAISTDLSVLALESSGWYSTALRPRSISVGGDDLDRLLYSHVAEVAGHQAGHAVLDTNAIDLGALLACRLVKESLSSSDTAAFEYATRNGTTNHLRVSINRVELEGLVRPKLEEVFRCASEVLASAADRGRAVDTVILTGGGSLMPLAQRLVHAGLSAAAVLIDHHCTSASLGAAWFASGRVSGTHSSRITTNTPTKPATAPAPPAGEAMPPLDSDEITPELAAELEVFRKKIEAARTRRFAFMLVGRTGVGKSSTLNSLFGWKVAETNRYERQTTHVSVHTRELDGIPFSIIDTPGLCDEDSDQNSDLRYLEEMRTVGKQIDSLWFVTRLDDRRLGRDEKLTIKLISESFKPEIWKHAVIVFTHADLSEDFSKDLAMRSELVRREIARYTGSEIATDIPAVAVNNTSNLTPDGKKWKGELYFQTFMKVSREGLLTFALGTRSLLKPPPAHNHKPGRGEREDREDTYGRRTPRRYAQEDRSDGIELSEKQERQLGERVHRESFGGYVAAGAAGGAAGGAALGIPGGPIGMAIGAVVGGAIGAVGGAVVGLFKRLFG